MNLKVSVPGMSRMPWARRPNSLAAECVHFFLYWGLEMSCLYSRASSVSVSMTALAWGKKESSSADGWRKVSARGESGVRGFRSATLRLIDLLLRVL